jgi:hypothetical protein
MKGFSIRSTQYSAFNPFDPGVEYSMEELTRMAVEAFAAEAAAKDAVATAKIELLIAKADAQVEAMASPNERAFKAAVDARKAPLEVNLESRESAVESAHARVNIILTAMEGMVND